MLFRTKPISGTVIMTVIYLQYINCRVARIHKTTHSCFKIFWWRVQRLILFFWNVLCWCTIRDSKNVAESPRPSRSETRTCHVPSTQKKAMQTHTPSMVSVHLSAWQPELGFSGLDRGGRLHDCVRGRTPGEGGERSSAGHGSRRRERITPPGGQGRSREWS